MEAAHAVILSVDDDRDILEIVRITLGTAGYEVITAENGEDALRLAVKNRPSLVLLDAMMPGMDGYAVATEMLSIPDLQGTPIVFLTALTGEHDRQSAFAAGAVDYVTKPFAGNTLVAAVERHLNTGARFAAIGTSRTGWTERVTPADFATFKETLVAELGEQAAPAVTAVVPATIYSLAESTGVGEARIAELVARFFGVGFLPRVISSEIQLGVLPTPFCRTNLVVPINNQAVGAAFVVANPFNWDLIDTLERASGTDSYTLLVASPGTIRDVFEREAPSERGTLLTIDPEAVGLRAGAPRPGARELGMRPPAFLADHALAAAEADGASDIEFEPKAEGVSVGYRIDDVVHEAFMVSHEQTSMALSRFKALAGLDINERRRSQRGAFEVVIAGARYAVRVTTAASAYGEAMSLRLIRADVPPKTSADLGMLPEQAEMLASCLAARQGLIIVAAPPRSGKTTTAYTVLSMLGPSGRRITTAESPIEFRVPFTHQQSVDEPNGATYPSVISSIISQEPDVLFVGEIRDAESARSILRFAETGLAIATITASNATSAISALEALGIARPRLAASLLCLVGVRIAPLPCPECSSPRTLTVEEQAMLSPFGVTPDVQVADPAGCTTCRGTGSRGRTGIFEVFVLTDALREQIASGATPAEIRSTLQDADTKILGSVALEALTAGRLTVEAALAAGLADDQEILAGRIALASATHNPEATSILLVDDAEDNRELLQSTLTSAGLSVSIARNGVEAVRLLERGTFDLVLSDLRMPLMDGFGLLNETARNFSVPLVIYSASTDPADEVRALMAGALDFFHVPVRREILLARVRHALATAGDMRTYAKSS
ncbi:MAG: ATPase, T2SS/T4P/T4SS family [Actinomycetota bacterium]|nr:ATPase, T2SS/T4P/T4SS family [Actinomycetota bacterium]MDP3630875.1 ATPase, T2SS/T4P/T4SS family [Actinomycetota bacterium]